MSCRTPPIFFLVIASALTACSPTPRATSTPSPVTAKPASSPVPLSWHPSRQPSLLRYTLQDSSVLSISSDSTTKQIPFITTAFLQLMISSIGDSFTFSGRSDSVLVHSELQKTTPIDTMLRIFGTISRQGAITQVQSPANSLCKIGIEPAIARITSLLVKIPETISINSRWTDSSTTIICHGKTALRQTVIRSYHVIADTIWGEHSALRVEDSTLLTISSVEGDSTNHIFATGNGLTATVLLLDANTGALLESSSHGSVLLTISTTRGTLPFRQFSFTRIRQR